MVALSGDKVTCAAAPVVDKVDTKLRRERIALIESALNVTTCFVQARVVDRRRDIAAGTQGQGCFQQGLKQAVRFPIGAGVQPVVRAPVLRLMSQSPDDAGEGAPPKAGQRAERLSHGAPVRTILGECGPPGGEQIE